MSVLAHIIMSKAVVVPAPVWVNLHGQPVTLDFKSALAAAGFLVHAREPRLFDSLLRSTSTYRHGQQIGGEPRACVTLTWRPEEDDSDGNENNACSKSFIAPTCAEAYLQAYEWALHNPIREAETV